jgi:NitT/TauT family transport system permease protein
MVAQASWFNTATAIAECDGPTFGEHQVAIWARTRRRSQAASDSGGIGEVGRDERTLRRLGALLSPLALILAWEAASLLGIIDRRFFPPPSLVGEAFFSLLTSGRLIEDITVSLARVSVGFTVGASLAVFLGVFLGVHPTPRALLSPVVSSVYSIPKTALLPLFLLLFGLGEASKIIVIGTSVFFLTLVNTIQGVLLVPRIYFDVASNSSAPQLLMLRTVALPGAMPYVLTGLKLSWGVALILIVVAEMLAASTGIGYLITSSWRLLKVHDMVVGIIVIGAIGYASNAVFDILERRIMPWAPSRSGDAA